MDRLEEQSGIGVPLAAPPGLRMVLACMCVDHSAGDMLRQLTSYCPFSSSSRASSSAHHLCASCSCVRTYDCDCDGNFSEVGAWFQPSCIDTVHFQRTLPHFDVPSPSTVKARAGARLLERQYFTELKRRDMALRVVHHKTLVVDGPEYGSGFADCRSHKSIPSG